VCAEPAAVLKGDRLVQPLLGGEQQLVADSDSPAFRHVAADDDFAAAEDELALLERVGGENFMFQQLFGGGAEHDDAGVEVAVDLDDHRRLDDRSRFAARLFDRVDGHFGVVEHTAVVGPHLKVRLGFDQLLLHEVGEAGHHREDDDEHRHAEGHPENAQHRDQ